MLPVTAKLVEKVNVTNFSIMRVLNFNTSTISVFPIHSTAVHSDGTGYVLLVACNSGGRGGWAVASDQRNLTNEAKQEIMTRVASFGFDTTDVLEINYSKCEYGVNPAVQEGQCKEDIPTVSPGSRDKVQSTINFSKSWQHKINHTGPLFDRFSTSFSKEFTPLSPVWQMCTRSGFSLADLH